MKKFDGPISEAVFARSFSQNAKVGNAAVTGAAQVSCPPDCVFIAGGGCYAEDGGHGFITSQLNEVASERSLSPLAVARLEAAAIDSMKVRRGRPMRLHSVGDCATNAAAKIVSAAAERYVERGGGDVWTYTHGWRRVARSAWGKVSVLASCESAKDVRAAAKRGYAAALVVPEFASRAAYELDGVVVIPCPAQTTKDVTCASCRLCCNDTRLLDKGLVIGLEVHGGGLARKRARLAIERPDDPRRRLSSRDVLYEFLEEHDRWPSVNELARAAACTTGSAMQMLRRVREELVEAR